MEQADADTATTTTPAVLNQSRRKSSSTVLDQPATDDTQLVDVSAQPNPATPLNRATQQSRNLQNP